MIKSLKLIKLLLSSRYFKISKLFIVCLFLFKNSISQNLIRNGSFEIYDSIDCGGGGFDNYSMTGNPHVVDNWYGYFTPDYFNTVCTNGPLPNQYGFDIPVNFFGYSNAKNGSAYIGLAFYQKTDESKEYVYQHLDSPLQSGKIYCLNFFVSRSYRSTYAIKNIEVLFSNSLINLSNGYIQATPQIIKQANFVADTTIWTEIQGCFTANGGEQYVMIGNFNNNTNTDTLFIGTTNPIPSYGDFSYYYIDDINLIDQTTVGIKDVSYLSEVVRVFPNPVNDILNVSFATEKQGRKIELYDAIGNLLLEKDASSNNLSLTTDNLSNGIYFYTILVGEKNIKTDKVVIIK